MICNKILIALSALLVVATAMPWFAGLEEMGTFEAEYATNEEVWGNAPLKANPFEIQAPEDQYATDDQAGDNNQVAEQGAGGDSSNQEGDTVAGQAFGGADAFANRGATFNGAPAAGGNSDGDDDHSPDTGNAAAAAAAPGAGQQGVRQAAGAQGFSPNNIPNNAPAVNAGNAPAAGGESQHVNAVGGPPPGELKSENSKTKGLGIAVGVSLLVVATAAVAVFAIRYHRRYRF